MRKSIRTSDLKVGMYVHIPLPWYKHPFLKNIFKINSENQIRKIIAHGIRSVFCDDDGQRVTKTENKSMPAGHTRQILPSPNSK